MTNIEIEQLKNDVALKVGILKMKINNSEINDSTSQELVDTFEDYEKNGTTLEELKLFYEDVKLALN